MKERSSTAKAWQNATIQDNFIFGKTMEMNPEICRRLIEIILNIQVKKISYPEREKVIESRTDSKGIRLDVYIEDNQNRSFDLEMQIANSDNISKRMRYYQGLIDGDKLKHGRHYNTLGDSYIIFICPFDKFKQGRHIYVFRERCDQDFNLTLDDGSTKIFLSTKGTLNDVSEDVKAFLDYVDSGIINGDFVQKIDDAVQSVKTNQKARLEFMTYQMALIEKELEGEERGRESVAINLINMGMSIEKIQEATSLSLEKIKELMQKIEAPA